MNFKEIQELIALINKSNLAEFKMKDGEFELTIRTNKYVRGKQIIQSQAPVASAPPVAVPAVNAALASTPSSAPKAEAAPSRNDNAEAKSDASVSSGSYLEIKSPIVGTFYRSSGPDKPSYVKVGDTVDVGSVVCIVEAMKLFNEIESEVKGRVVKVMVEDASPVEYDQVLFLVDPKG